ncbi:hypothetical protein [Streptomyces sp. NPDC021020]|uniref:hypothetical protein n=1 Tax=Streptomyces sp. NPDC021020 TaxID=3365109 RepID=UPI003793F286
MSTGTIIALAVAVVVIAAAIAAVLLQSGGTGPGMKRRFGPEYERTLAVHDGDARAARRELAGRVKRYRGMERATLDDDTRQRYAGRWTAIQGQFVDDPGAALAEAEAVVSELAVECGYPAADSPEHVEALSVHHPYHVQGYRDAHAAATDASLDTEGRRTALVAARGLFEQLLAAAAPAEHAGGVKDAEGSAESSAEDADGYAKAPLGKRFAALTERGRTTTGAER